MKHVSYQGCKGAFTAFVLEAETPALLCKGALGALGVQLDFEKDALLRHATGEMEAGGAGTNFVSRFDGSPQCTQLPDNNEKDIFQAAHSQLGGWNGEGDLEMQPMASRPLSLLPFCRPPALLPIT